LKIAQHWRRSPKAEIHGPLCPHNWDDDQTGASLTKIRENKWVEFWHTHICFLLFRQNCHQSGHYLGHYNKEGRELLLLRADINHHWSFRWFSSGDPRWYCRGTCSWTTQKYKKVTHCFSMILYLGIMIPRLWNVASSVMYYSTNYSNQTNHHLLDLTYHAC
jgi:hypothetical protein